MDENLSDDEQLEVIREWWREYGWYLIGGVLLGVAILSGIRQYDTYQLDQSEAAAALYQELARAIADDADNDALSLLEQLRNEYPSSPYTDQAGLSIVIMHLGNQSTRGAMDSLRYTLENTPDEHLAKIARLRLARLLVSSGRHDEAFALLDGVDPGAFSARFSEIRGDIYYAQGDSDSARSAYSQALNDEQSALVDRGLVQMKLDDLPAAVVPLVQQEVLTEDDSG
ncbi:MAG: tetratricopeptide repeat protein [Gammaproteobacteria bacterium]